MSNLIITKSIFPENTSVFYAGIVLNSFLFFYAPILYLFAKSTIDASISIKKYWAHFIPFVIFLTLNVVLVIMLLTINGSKSIETILWIRNSFDKLYFIQVLTYTALSFWVVHKHRKENQRYVKIAKWLKQILTLFFVIWLVFLASSYHDLSQHLVSLFSIIGSILLLILANIVLFQLLNHPEYFYNNLIAKPRRENTSSKINEAVYNDLCELVLGQKLYKKPDLKISDLSEALGESARNISILINSYSNGNFYDFINYYRIQEAKSLLKNGNDDMTILAILYESGFNSKSVFNNVFKKMEGQTPSSYRKKYLATLYG